MQATEVPSAIPDSDRATLELKVKLAGHTAAEPRTMLLCPASADTSAAQPPAPASVQLFAADPAAVTWDVSVGLQDAKQLPGMINPAVSLLIIDSPAAEADSTPDVSCDTPEASCESVDEDMVVEDCSSSDITVAAYSNPDMMVGAYCISDHAADALSCSSVPNADCSSDSGVSLQGLQTGTPVKRECYTHLSYTAVRDETHLEYDDAPSAECDSITMPTAASCDKSEEQLADSTCSNAQSGAQSPLAAADLHMASDSSALSGCAAGSMLDDMMPSAACASLSCQNLEQECYSAATAAIGETCQQAASDSSSISHPPSSSAPLNYTEHLSCDESTSSAGSGQEAQSKWKFDGFASLSTAAQAAIQDGAPIAECDSEGGEPWGQDALMDMHQAPTHSCVTECSEQLSMQPAHNSSDEAAVLAVGNARQQISMIREPAAMSELPMKDNSASAKAHGAALPTQDLQPQQPVVTPPAVALLDDLEYTPQPALLEPVTWEGDTSEAATYEPDSSYGAWTAAMLLSTDGLEEKPEPAPDLQQGSASAQAAPVLHGLHPQLNMSPLEGDKAAVLGTENASNTVAATNASYQDGDADSDVKMALALLVAALIHSGWPQASDVVLPSSQALQTSHGMTDSSEQSQTQQTGSQQEEQADYSPTGPGLSCCLVSQYFSVCLPPELAQLC